VMARKPLDGTIANNVLKHDTGGINIDECRIGNEKRFLDPATPSKGTFNASFDSNYQGKQVNGRFPANFIHDGSEEVVVLFPNSDEESPARFFYTAKASQSERNWGLDGFEEKIHSDRKNHDGVGGDNPRNRTNKPKKNIHPTVKPIDLMRYLVRLVTPKGGVCLDPYLGSGTTAIACKAEKFDYIGIEMEEEYAQIAEARIKAETVMYDIFDFMEDGE